MPNQSENQETYEEKFLKSLSVIADDDNYELFLTKFANPLISTLSSNGKRFYQDAEMIKDFYKKHVINLVGMNKDSGTLKDIAEVFSKNPLGIFSYITNQDFSDIFIVRDKVSCTANNKEMSTDIVIPTELLEAYGRMVDLLIDTTRYASDLSNTKLDPSNGVLDFSVKKMRFNVVHGSLNANSDRPIIAIRKQTMGAISKIDYKEYAKSLGASRNQMNTINDLAKNGSYIIFGETGSGKTTLLRYMCMLGLDKKRNLISIEDTPELFLPVNITFLTNKKYKIIDLFKITLRENPSHIIVGETRSEEIIDILQSGLTSKVGTTIHANSLEKAIMRILFMAKNTENGYDTGDLQNLITATVDGFIFMEDRQVKGVWVRKEDFGMDGNSFNDFREVF